MMLRRKIAAIVQKRLVPRQDSMRRAPLAAAMAVAVSSAAFAAFAPDGGLGHYPAAPARPHVALGPVQTLVRAPAGSEDAATPLAEAARARYGRVDAIAGVRTAPLPFADAALATGTAVRWE
jgi:hypothetical protein